MIIYAKASQTGFITDNCNCLTLNIRMHVDYKLQSPEATHE